VQLYANLPLPLAAALDLEAGETVTWKVLDRTPWLGGAFAVAQAAERPSRAGAEEVAACAGGQAMMGKCSPQAWGLAADPRYLDYVRRETIYGYLAQHGEDRFRDEDFAAFHILTGKVMGQCLPRHRGREFVRFLQQVEGEMPLRSASMGNG
jgi:hypothetical protein